MKRNLLYLGVLLLLAGLTWFFVFREPGTGFSRGEAHFTVKDTNAVTALFLSDMQGNGVKLTRNGKAWTLNDSLRPRPDAISFLLDALAQQVPDQPVPGGFHDAAVRELSANGVKVEVYEGKDKTHCFYVAKNPGSNNVTYMLTEGAKRPFIVKVPLQGNVFLGVRYMTRLADWMDRHILFAEAPIEQVHVRYTDSAQYSFVLDNTGKDIQVSGASVPVTALNRKRAESYLRLLDQVYCTGYEDLYQRRDSIIAHGRQLGSVVVRRKGLPADSLMVYFKPTDKGTKAMLKVGADEFDFDAFFGLINGKSFLQISRRNAEKIFRSFPEFYTEDQPGAKP